MKVTYLGDYDSWPLDVHFSFKLTHLAHTVVVVVINIYNFCATVGGMVIHTGLRASKLQLVRLSRATPTVRLGTSSFYAREMSV